MPHILNLLLAALKSWLGTTRIHLCGQMKQLAQSALSFVLTHLILSKGESRIFASRGRPPAPLPYATISFSPMSSLPLVAEGMLFDAGFSIAEILRRKARTKPADARCFRSLT